jgi:hypothetical protein
MNMMQNNVYAATARFDGTARALTEDEMRTRCPPFYRVHQTNRGVK